MVTNAPCQIPLLTRTHRPPRITLVRTGEYLKAGEDVVPEAPEQLFYEGKICSATPFHFRGRQYYALTNELEKVLLS